MKEIMHRGRLILIPALLLFIALLGWVFLKQRNTVGTFPTANVLLITIDTIRPDFLSCYGSSNRTPNIDGIANRGILFENAFSQVPLTLPSHSSILTGLFPTHHGIHQNGLDIFTKTEDLITETYRAHGFKTGAVVSAFVLDRKFGLAQGFDRYDDKMERLPQIATNFEVERRADQTVAAATQILQEFEGKKWFLWVHFYDPHTPYNPPPPAEGYAGEITYVDKQIGRLMDILKEKELDKNLILALLGDHGESLGEHGEKTHGFFVYNSTLHIPMILSYPGAKQSRVSNIVASVDVAPTLLELSALNNTLPRDGESLLRRVADKKRDKDIYFESKYAELLGWNGLQGLIRGNWKLISTTRSELYDLTSDTAENRNLFSARQDISQSIKNDLAQLSSTDSSQKPMDPETAEKLKSLGYVGTGAIPKKNRTADPKDKIALWTRYEESLEAMHKNQHEQTETLLVALVEQEPSNNFFRLALASFLRQQKNLEAAIKQLQLAVVNDPEDATAYHELAVTFKELRNYAEALRAEEAAIALQPQRSEFRGVRGMIWVETGQFQKAKEEFLQALKMDPNNAIAWNNLGNAYRALDELDNAETAYKKAIALSPHYAYPENGLATVLVKRNNQREAIPHFEKAIQLDPKFFEVYLNLGIAFHSLNEQERAKTLYLAFLKMAPDWMEQEKRNAQILLNQLR
jgi:arylsulfatase A-like enzyme/Flp pilus assembly protein TadD